MLKFKGQIIAETSDVLYTIDVHEDGTGTLKSINPKTGEPRATLEKKDIGILIKTVKASNRVFQRVIDNLEAVLSGDALDKIIAEERERAIKEEEESV